MRKNKGITLIALVITIIVLLILAGVAISMLSGENGILRKASEAKTKTEDASFAEQAKLIGMEAMVDSNEKIDKETLKERLGVKEEDIEDDQQGGYVVKKGANRINITKNGNVVNLEDLSDIDIELTEYFKNNNLPYKCTYGYITGVEFNWDESVPKSTIKELEDVLPEGYTIGKKYNSTKKTDEEITDKNIKLTTGIAILKNNQEVARTVIFGDINCDGEMDASDATDLTHYFNFMSTGSVINIQKDFQKIAGNVYDDNELNGYDSNIIVDYTNFTLDEINQNKSIVTRNLKRCYEELQGYISLAAKDKGYSFEYNSETDTYKLKVDKTKIKTVKNLKDILPKSDEINIVENENASQGVDESKNIENGYYLMKYIKDKNGNSLGAPRFACIEIIE